MLSLRPDQNVNVKKIKIMSGKRYVQALVVSPKNLIDDLQPS